MFLNKNIFYLNFETVDNPKANIIFLHGLGENTKDYLHLLNFFKSSNYNFLFYDQRGHGKSGGKRGDIKNFHIFIDDLKSIINFVKTKNNLKIFLIGHSMGGIIVNCYLVKYGDVDGAIISSVPFSIKEKTKKYLKYPFYLWNFKNKNLNFSSQNISHFDLNKDYNPYRLNYVTPRLLRNLLVLSPKFLKKKINCYLTPILILNSLKDKIAPYKDTDIFFNQIISKDKSLYFYKESYHNLFHDIEKKKVLKDIFLWLEKRK
jgi:alpha-beta hydrolase superfamily lysophospholipase